MGRIFFYLLPQPTDMNIYRPQIPLLLPNDIQKALPAKNRAPVGDEQLQKVKFLGR